MIQPARFARSRLSTFPTLESAVARSLAAHSLATRSLVVGLILVGLAACAEPDAPSRSADADPGAYEGTVILVSTDGAHPSYLARAPTPALDRLAAEGVSAPRGMIPVFPTKTFPNHYSIVTGLYPAAHGIVGNSMFDPRLGERFSIRSREAIENPAWWIGEPIWATAERQGIRTATYFWVGSETPWNGTRPSYWHTYDGSIPNTDRVEAALDWLDLPHSERPRFISLYFSHVDDAGHRAGPNAEIVDTAMVEMDALMAQLLDGLSERGILDAVNILWVSDHGMADLDTERFIFLDDYIDLDDVFVVESGANVAINARAGKLDAVYDALQDAHPELTIWMKDDVPERFHFDLDRAGSHRITDLVGFVSDGWFLRASRQGFNPARDPGGTHGYDNQLASMRAVFAARGPAFRPGMVLEPFEGVHLYTLMAHLLDIEPAENDGDLDVFAPVLGPQ